MKKSNKMNSLTDSHWVETEVELIKSVEGYEKKVSNKKSGIIDYVTGEGEGEKLLRVVLNKKPRSSKALTETVKDSIVAMKEGGYKEAVIIAEEVTYGAKKLIGETEHLDYISQDLRSPHSLTELLDAIQRKTIEHCESRCGKAPTTDYECKGYSDGKYSCVVRRLSDDSDFHAKMGWMSLLYCDFSKLVMIMGKSTGKRN